MTTRTLGQELKISALGLGCMGMSEFYGESDDADSLTTLDKALDLGCNFWDTADMYGTGANELLLAKAVNGRRDKVVLATKFGNERDPDDKSFRRINGRPEYVRSACDASLKRLGTDHIDLYYQHRVDPTVPIEDTVGAMSELVSQGKVRFLGLSEAGVETIRRAHKVHPIAALQTEYSLWSRDVEDEILPALRELGIGFVPYSPLGRGFLTGQITKFEDLEEGDFRRVSPRFQGENFDMNLKLVDRIISLARDKGCKASQLALAWLLAQGADIVPIPGTRNVARLEENLGALTVSLAADELAHIDDIAPRGVAAGERYPAAAMVNLGR